MLKKLTLLTATALFTMTMGVANAAESTTEKAPVTTNAIELTSTEMDSVSAGGISSTAFASGLALAFGEYTTASTITSSIVLPGAAAASSQSSAASYTHH